MVTSSSADKGSNRGCASKFDFIHSPNSSTSVIVYTIPEKVYHALLVRNNQRLSVKHMGHPINQLDTKKKEKFLPIK
jgi:hypothetical protein